MVIVKIINTFLNDEDGMLHATFVNISKKINVEYHENMDSDLRYLIKAIIPVVECSVIFRMFIT